MMSKQGYGGDSAPHWPSHLMFFYSKMDPASWGANLPGSPVIAVSDDRLTEFAIGAGRWSEGTEARSAEDKRKKEKNREIHLFRILRQRKIRRPA
jgi:hypothetical protein